MWDAALDAMGFLIAFFYRVIPNYGVAIILLTVVVKLAMFPLTAKQIRSMQRMQQIQPEIKKLQAKYKGDRQKLNEEMMKFYQENKVNPLAGCLPLLVQMPIFIALNRVLYKIQFHIPKTGSNGRLYRDVCSVGGTLRTPGKCQPKLDFLGMDLSKHANDFSGAALTPYIILIVLVVATAYLQQKQSMRNQTQVNPQMQMVARIMPVFFGFISYTVPAGLTLYFLMSNVWQIGQQELVFRKMPPPGPLPQGGGVIDVPESSTRSRGWRRLLEGPETTAGTDDGGSGDQSNKPPASEKPRATPPASEKPRATPPAPQNRRRNKKRRR